MDTTITTKKNALHLCFHNFFPNENAPRLDTSEHHLTLQHIVLSRHFRRKALQESELLMLRIVNIFLSLVLAEFYTWEPITVITTEGFTYVYYLQETCLS